MKEQKKKVFTWRINLFIFIIFMLGFMFGSVIQGIAIPRIEGYLLSRTEVLDSNGYTDLYWQNPTTATSANATSCNATSANATSCNATSANATSSNATSANIFSTDKITVTQLTIPSEEVKAGEKIYIQCYTYGNCLENATLSFFNNKTGIGFSVPLEFEEDRTYIVIPDEVAAGKYYFENILLNATSYRGGNFTTTYTADNLGISESAINIKKDESQKDIELKSIKFASDEVKLGENLEVKLDTDSEVLSAKFTFRNSESDEKVVAYLKKDKDSDYISFPSSIEEGTYKLEELILSNTSTTTIYTKDGEDGTKQYPFNNEIKILKGDSELLEYNNEDITEETIKEITNSKNITKVIINADYKSIITEKIFKAIKGKNIDLIVNYKGDQFIFNGKKISEVKDIDVSIKSYSLSYKNDEIKEYVGNKGIVLVFAPNGKLPGTAEVKIKQTSEMKRVLGTNSLFVYYFDEDTLKFEEIAQNVQVDSDNFYTFKLTHNSKFLLTDTQLDESLMQESQVEVVSFLMSSKVYLLLIALAIVLIIIVIVVIIVYNKNKSKKENNSISNVENVKEDENVIRVGQEENKNDIE